RNGDKQRRRQQLNRRITKRDVFLAMPALRTQHDVTEDRYVVVKRDPCATRRTTRVWKDDRLLDRHTMNDNVEETADDRPKNSCDHISKERWKYVQVRHLNPCFPCYPRSVFPRASGVSKTRGARRSSQS